MMNIRDSIIPKGWYFIENMYNIFKIPKDDIITYQEKCICS